MQHAYLTSVVAFFLEFDRQLDTVHSTPSQCIQALRMKVSGPAAKLLEREVHAWKTLSYGWQHYLLLRRTLITAYTPGGYEQELELRLRSSRQGPNVSILEYLANFDELVSWLPKTDAYLSEVGRYNLLRDSLSLD